jgi:hypothetical protein
MRESATMRYAAAIFSIKLVPSSPISNLFTRGIPRPSN